jgi:sugar O-acyltransferase (sialic acid O-acetyltransferase NeuD family)
MKKAIIGSGGFGREVKQLLLDNNQNEEIVFFVDDDYIDKISMPLSKFDVNEFEVVIAIGDPVKRKNIVDRLPINTKFFTAVHKSVQLLDSNIQIGEGSILCAGTILTTNITIGKHCHLNLLSTIGHDTIIGDYFTTAPGTKTSGNCKIGNNVYFGTNSSVREKISICDNVVVGLNAGVVKNITESGIYVGVPAKKIK